MKDSQEKKIRTFYDGNNQFTIACSTCGWKLTVPKMDDELVTKVAVKHYSETRHDVIATAQMKGWEELA